jgi:hypothetical protein
MSSGLLGQWHWTWWWRWRTSLKYYILTRQWHDWSPKKILHILYYQLLFLRFKYCLSIRWGTAEQKYVVQIELATNYEVFSPVALYVNKSCLRVPSYKWSAAYRTLTYISHFNEIQMQWPAICPISTCSIIYTGIRVLYLLHTSQLCVGRCPEFCHNVWSSISLAC